MIRCCVATVVAGKWVAGNGTRCSQAAVRDRFGIDQARQHASDSVAAADLGRATLTSAAGEPFAERVKVSHVSDNLFNVLGVAPLLGRTITANDANAGMQAVISYELWQSHFAGTPDILGRTVRLNNTELDIVGVMPAGFAYPEPVSNRSARASSGAWPRRSAH